MTEAKRLIEKYGKAEASYELSNNEMNDCVVRAVSHAFGVDYIDAHHWCEVKLRRQQYHGIFTNLYLPKVQQAFGKKIKHLGKPGKFNKLYRYLTRPQKSKVKTYI